MARALLPDEWPDPYEINEVGQPGDDEDTGTAPLLVIGIGFLVFVASVLISIWWVTG